MKHLRKCQHIFSIVQAPLALLPKQGKSAGTKAFDIWKDIFISTNSYSYTIGFTNYEPKQIILEKLYHELPSKKEFVITIEKCIESIVDDIAQQIERIKK